jgi:hypothetical protein
MIGVRQLIEPRSALGDPELVRHIESEMADTSDYTAKLTFSCRLVFSTF